MEALKMTKYQKYEIEKQKLSKLQLTATQYERAIQKIVKKLKL